MRNANLVVGDCQFAVPRDDLLHSCERFRENPALLNFPYRVNSQISPRVARLFVDILQMTNGPIPNDALHVLSLLSRELGGPRIVAIAPPFPNSHEEMESSRSSFHGNTGQLLGVLPWVLVSLFCAWTVWNVRRFDGLERELESSRHKIAEIETSLSLLSKKMSKQKKASKDRVEQMVVGLGSSIEKLEKAMSVSSSQTDQLAKGLSSSSDKIERMQRVLSESKNTMGEQAQVGVSTEIRVENLEKMFVSLQDSQVDTGTKMRSWARRVNDDCTWLHQFQRVLEREALAGNSLFRRVWDAVQGVNVPFIPRVDSGPCDFP
jgi:hypothetical protein